MEPRFGRYGELCMGKIGETYVVDTHSVPTNVSFELVKSQKRLNLQQKVR